MISHLCISNILKVHWECLISIWPLVDENELKFRCYISLYWTIQVIMGWISVFVEKCEYIHCFIASYTSENKNVLKYKISSYYTNPCVSDKNISFMWTF